MPRARQTTAFGKYYHGDSVEILGGPVGRELRGNVQLIFTSPPFPLNKKKAYGNLTGDNYLRWFEDLAPLMSELLTDDGSIVLELGNSWLADRPVQSLLHLEALLAFVKNERAGLRLCQQFVCYNPSRLPSPAQWVTIDRSRVTDSFTHLWWMARTDRPKADNRRVLRPYSKDMLALLKRGTFNRNGRPSEHHISEAGFLNDNGGSIAQNLFEIEPMDPGGREPRLPNAFSLANTGSNDFFLRACRSRGIAPHPARMPSGLVSFFVEFLTDPGDLVLDPFAGSNTTGFVAQSLKRRWVSIETRAEYVAQSRLRFKDPALAQPPPDEEEAWKPSSPTRSPRSRARTSSPEKTAS